MTQIKKAWMWFLGLDMSPTQKGIIFLLSLVTCALFIPCYILLALGYTNVISLTTVYRILEVPGEILTSAISVLAGSLWFWSERIKK